MKVQIEFSCDNAAFEDFPAELKSVLIQARSKILTQVNQHPNPELKCYAPESIHKLLDSNGNTIGIVQVEQ